MHITQHADQRMNQRGISRRLMEFTLWYGRIEGDKHVLDRAESRRVIERLTEELRQARQAMDKGGVTVVEGEEDIVVTAYSGDTSMRRDRGFAASRVARGEVSRRAGSRALPARGEHHV